MRFSMVKKPNFGYFRVFGSKCFYQIKGLRLTKFQPKALEDIFVGYGEESHTYRIYDITSRIVVNSCSVIFEETDRKSTRLNSSHSGESRMPSSA